MIWDCFPYWRERSLVAARQEMWRQAGVDVNLVAFVGDRTHRGTLKPPCPPPPDGVRVVNVVLDAADDWARERQQRDAVLSIEMDPDDLVLLCDADELVDPGALGRIEAQARHGNTALEMWVYPFDYRWRCARPWRQAKATYARDLRGLPGDVRGRWVMGRVRLAGWHLTTQDDEKFAAFAHAECDTAEHRAKVQRCRRERTDLEGVALVDDRVPESVVCLL